MMRYPLFGLLVLLATSTAVYADAVYADKGAQPDTPVDVPQHLEEGAVVVDPTCVQIPRVREKIAKNKSNRIDKKLFNGLKGKRIRKIYFETMSIFDKDDPDENNRFYMFLNTLHINTRPSVIRTQLLFREGDSLVPSQVYESERILRKRDYLTNAYIVPTEVCAEQLDLTVVTQDSWALEPQISMSRKSEDTQTGFAIADGNILGTGSSFTISYEENEARNLVGYEFSNPHVFHSQISARLFYADTSDGRNSIVDISHPFYSLESKWSAGVYLQDLTLDETIYSADEEINGYKHQSTSNQIYAGIATDINDSFTQRWLVGVTAAEENFAPNEETLLGIPIDRKETYPWLEYQFLQNRFGVFKNVNQIQRPEDIALGHNLILRLGYAGTGFDNEDEFFRYIGQYTYIAQLGEQHIIETGLTLDGRHHQRITDADSSLAGIKFAYNYFADDKNRWYTAFRYDVGQDLAQYEEITLGDITGMRGYPTDFQRGNESYLFTVERRYFSDVHIFNLLRMGAVVFLDVGKAWGIDDYAYSPLLSNVGFGLRFSSTKVRIGNVIHVDVATPTTARDNISRYQVTVGAYKQF